VDGVTTFTQRYFGAGLQAGVTETIAQQFLYKSECECCGVYIRTLKLSGKMFPLCAGDLEGATVVIFKLEPLGGTIVGFGLPLGSAKCGFFQLIRQK